MGSARARASEREKGESGSCGSCKEMRETGGAAGSSGEPVKPESVDSGGVNGRGNEQRLSVDSSMVCFSCRKKIADRMKK